MKKIMSLIIVLSILLIAVSLKAIAAGNNAEKMYEEGMEYFEKEDYDHAFSYFQISGEVKGYAPAQNMLGICYRDGLGIEADIAEAEKYFRLSANQGYAPAQKNLTALEEARKEEVKGEKEHVDIASVSVGDYITFGSYEQDNDLTNGKEPIEWLVLNVQGNRALIISKYAIDAQRFDKDYYPYNPWEESHLRTWLNSYFLKEVFNLKEQAIIPSVTISNDKNLIDDKESEGITQDQIFVLSISESEGLLTSSKARKCQPTEYAKVQGLSVNSDNNCWWWLRSPGLDQRHAFVRMDGSISKSGDYIYGEYGAVRPALWLTLNNSENTQQESPTEEKEIDSLIDFSLISVGDYYTFGSYEQDNDLANGKEPVEWQVLDVQDGEALLLSRFALVSKPFEEDKNNATWETSSLRAWLNGEMYNSAFTADERAIIINSDVSADKNPKYGTSSGGNSRDHVFLLSITEAEKYFSNAAERVCRLTEKGKENSRNDNSCWWWLRTAGNSTANAGVVNVQGAILNSGDSIHKSGGVRPAIWIKTGFQKSENTENEESAEEPIGIPEKPKTTIYPVLAGGTILIDNDRLSVSYTAEDLLVTLKGLEIKDQYITNKDGAQESILEYGWRVDFTDYTHKYEVSTTSWAFSPGLNQAKSIDNMQHSLWMDSHSTASRVKMEHTDNSIIWEVDLAVLDASIDFSLVREFTVQVIEDGNYYLIKETYPVEEAKELPTDGEFEFVVLQDGSVQITQYIGMQGTVIIPEKLNGKTVTKINEKAFSGRDDLISVEIPGSIEEIPSGAFMQCSNLKTVTIMEGVKSIGVVAFWECKKLETITIPASVTTIGWDNASVFWYNTSYLHAFVKQGSFAEEYCKTNNIGYSYY